jgi:hypothetical protein
MSMAVCLTLLLPQALAEEVVDLVLLQIPILGGGPFTTLTVDGHGTPGDLSNVHEQVRGRAARTRIDLLMKDANTAVLLIDSLRVKLSDAAIDWWLIPVLDCGTFGPEK